LAENFKVKEKEAADMAKKYNIQVKGE